VLINLKQQKRIESEILVNDRPGSPQHFESMRHVLEVEDLKRMKDDPRIMATVTTVTPSQRPRYGILDGKFESSSIPVR
jgi:hypothetical protein